MIAIVSVGLLSTVGLAACSDSGDGTSGSAGNKFEEIMERGVINAGSCLSTVPWGVLNPDGEPDGFDVDVVRELAAYLGIDYHVEDVHAASRVPSLQTDQLDIISCTFTVTEERLEQVDFSDPVVLTGNSLIAQEGTDISSVDDLPGRVIAAVKGGTSIPIAEEVAPEATIQPYEDQAAAILAVRQGQADAMIDTSGSMTEAVSRHDDIVMVVDGDIGDKAPFAIGVKQGEQELVDAINEFLVEFHAQKRGSELYEKWFGSEPTFQFEGIE